jgi:AcrR family transcriptional regulator
MSKIKAGREALTRQRLLNAAAEAFAERGFHGATTREIAARGDVNIASLHYHFQDKRRLYLAVFEHFVDRMWAEYPLPETLEQPLPPQRRLAIFIESALRRLLEEGRPAWMWKLASREMTDPTEALDIVIQRMSRPLFAALSQIVGELLGRRASDEIVRLCSASVVGQCFFYRFARPLIERLAPGQGSGDAAIKKLAGHITRFSLQAIESMRGGRRGVGGRVTASQV